jgi:hypothetical protein
VTHDECLVSVSIPYITVCGFVSPTGAIHHIFSREYAQTSTTVSKERLNRLYYLDFCIHTARHIFSLYTLLEGFVSSNRTIHNTI